jgi:hypothetical protein
MSKIRSLLIRLRSSVLSESPSRANMRKNWWVAANDVLAHAQQFDNDSAKHVLYTLLQASRFDYAIKFTLARHNNRLQQIDDINDDNIMLAARAWSLARHGALWDCKRGHMLLRCYVKTLSRSEFRVFSERLLESETDLPLWIARQWTALLKTGELDVGGNDSDALIQFVHARLMPVLDHDDDVRARWQRWMSQRAARNGNSTACDGVAVDDEHVEGVQLVRKVARLHGHSVASLRRRVGGAERVDEIFASVRADFDVARYDGNQSALIVAVLRALLDERRAAVALDAYDAWQQRAPQKSDSLATLVMARQLAEWPPFGAAEQLYDRVMCHVANLDAKRRRFDRVHATMAALAGRAADLHAVRKYTRLLAPSPRSASIALDALSHCDAVDEALRYWSDVIEPWARGCELAQRPGLNSNHYTTRFEALMRADRLEQCVDEFETLRNRDGMSMVNGKMYRGIIGPLRRAASTAPLAQQLLSKMASMHRVDKRFQHFNDGDASLRY